MLEVRVVHIHKCLHSSQCWTTCWPGLLSQKNTKMRKVVQSITEEGKKQTGHEILFHRSWASLFCGIQISSFQIKNLNQQLMQILFHLSQTFFILWNMELNYRVHSPGQQDNRRERLTLMESVVSTELHSHTVDMDGTRTAFILKEV